MSFLWLPFTLLLIAWAIAGYKGISIPGAVKWQSRFAGILLALVIVFVPVISLSLSTEPQKDDSLSWQILLHRSATALGLILTVLAFSGFAFAGSSFPSSPYERRRDRDRDRDPNRQRRTKNRRRFSEGEDPGEPPTSRPL